MDTDEYMERLIRDRAVPSKPGEPGLPPRERRAWWEFCLEMAEFLGNLIGHRKVTGDQAQQLARLRWICLQGSYVLASADPALRAEQWRYRELCGCLAAAFAVVVDDPEGIADLCGVVLGQPRFFWSKTETRPIPKWPAEATALMENWERAPAPLESVREAARHNLWLSDNDGRCDSKGRRDRMGAKSVPRQAPEPVAAIDGGASTLTAELRSVLQVDDFLTPMESAFTREAVRQAYLRAGVPRKHAPFGVQIHFDGAKKRDNPAAYMSIYRVRDKLPAELRKLLPE
jgi:hypothetical protein